MFNTYSRYLQVKLIFNFIVIYFIFSSIIWLAQSLRFLEFITLKGIDFVTFISITGFLILPMSYVCIPISMLFASIIMFSNINHNNELLILKAMGVSCFQIYKAVLPVIMIIMIVHFCLSLYLLPMSYKSFKSIQHHLKEVLISSVFEDGVFNTQNNSITVYVDKKVGNYKFNNVFIYDLQNYSKPVTITARSGELIESPQGPGFILYNGTHQVEDKATKRITLGFFDIYSFTFKIDKNIAISRAVDPNEMSLSQLLATHGKNPSVINSHRIQAFQRILWPLFNLILSAIALSGICVDIFKRESNFTKQFKVATTGVALITIFLVVNNLAVKQFNYIFITFGLLVTICYYIVRKMRRV